MKKGRTPWIAAVVCAALLSGCGSPSQTAATVEPAAAKEPAPTESQAAPDPEPRQELTALEVARRMGNGINLGNTMEAYGRAQLGTQADISEYETLWGQPVTTQEMVSAMKDAGFDTLRIPVAWTNAMDYESGDYTIREEYLNRIEEIVNYGLNEDMYVMINDHWDGGWWGMFGSASKETRNQAMEMYLAIWGQLTERFQDYPDRLIFESANEELGDRLNEMTVCTDSGTLSEDECYDTVNRINQAFVDLVRESGGNNAERFLLIAGYNTDIEHTCDERFRMPEDTAKDKLLVSVHYYTPWGYSGSSSIPRWGTKAQYEEQNMLLEKMAKFTDQGYGVVIGEYAVMLNEDGTVKENTCDFMGNLLDNCDRYGYCPILWDTSSLFIRDGEGFFDPEVKELFASRSLKAQESLSSEEEASQAASRMEQALSAAPDSFLSDQAQENLGEPRAWIMFNSADGAVTYSAGDQYDPASATDGVQAADALVDGEGTYTVSLDFTGTSQGFALGTSFCAVGISGGEILYPDYVINVTDVQVNGQPATLSGKPYTVSDDGSCTRTNLYNNWVSEPPAEARTADHKLDGITATPLDGPGLGQIQTLSVTFEFGAYRSPFAG